MHRKLSTTICLLMLLACPGVHGATPAPAEAADAAGTAAKEIHVHIDRQYLIALENGEQKYRFDVVTGKEGKETTAGTYQIFRKHEKYESKTYGAEMPYTMFFSEDGKAIHGTQMAPLRSYLKVLGADQIGSMGCVGLTDDNAKVLFEWAPKGTRIIVFRDDGDEPVAE